MEVSKAVDLYRHLAKYPQTVSARVSHASDPGCVAIDTVQAQRDLERAEKIRFTRSFIVREKEGGKFDAVHRSQAQEISNEIWKKPSPTGKYNAVVRRVTDKKSGEKQFVEIQPFKGTDARKSEIWEGNTKIENFDVTAANKHGKIYEADGNLISILPAILPLFNRHIPPYLIQLPPCPIVTGGCGFRNAESVVYNAGLWCKTEAGHHQVHFGCLEWSNNEDKLLYVAEKKYDKKAVSFFAKTGSEDATNTEMGFEYDVKEDWGEGFTGKHIPVLCVLNIVSGEITVLEGIPENISAGLGKWLPGDEKIVFTGWDHEPYRLGILYCPIRKAVLYILDVQSGERRQITLSVRASMCSVLSPNKDSFVFLDTNIGGPHMQCMRLMKYNLETGTTSAITEEINSVKDDEFPGLFCVSLLDNCWSKDGIRVIVNSAWKCNAAAVVINTETKEISFLPSDCGGDITVLSIQEDIVIAQCASPNTPHYLVVGKLPQCGDEKNIVWSRVEEKTACLENVSWKTIKHNPTPDRINPKYGTLDYDSILVYKTSPKEGEKRKLVVNPHGGPHATSTTEFSLFAALLCEMGISVLFVNYRGSAGYGMDSIRSLLGRVGDQDVKDVQAAVEEVIDQEGYDKDLVFVCGGSHGGSLTVHLVGQYPTFYKAAMCRNPVINITQMLGSSDLPDCIYALLDLDYDVTTLPDGKVYEAMWKGSPLQYVDQIVCPILIVIGQEDKRVPIKQGHELYKALKARNKPVRYIAYPNNGHPIVKVDSEADFYINTYKWFIEHLPA